MTLATIFSGIGAAEFAAREVFDEYDIAFACEIDKFARQSYMANHEIDERHFHQDIKELDAKPYAGEIDILVGGSPCQDFSLAGLRAGTEGERGELIYEFIRIVDECKPKAFVYENVKGFLSIGKGRAYTEFKMALRELGYYIHDGILNTKDYGIAQNRERIYVVGFLDFDEYLNFDFAEKVPLTTTIKDYLDDEVDERYYLSEDTILSMVDADACFNGKFDPKEIDGCAGTITTSGGTRRTDTFVKIWQKPRGFNKGYELEICPTITSNSFESNNILNDSYRIRKLTPRECLRLQGFKDFKIVCSDTQTYKQAGNAMSVNVVAMILGQIKKAKNKNSDTLFSA
ncbi:DNA cytosine methyltransferase [Campylobacter curvus]|uniref:DNA cytosine methyltransferase n=1 Tax=Campylobacter curvus TaxID=200 RepID=UPI00146FF5A0|nr:DNA (cytosine-5-)-methyltransferase [Campylobacter curvus]